MSINEVGCLVGGGDKAFRYSVCHQNIVSRRKRGDKGDEMENKRELKVQLFYHSIT